MARALSIKNIEEYKPVEMEFSGRWAASFGHPELGWKSVKARI